MAYDVFLSSKSEDYASAQQVCEYLTQNEYRVFFSQRVLQEKGAADFRAQIDRAIEASQHLVVVTSRGQHVKGGWVEAEWGSFVNEKRSGRKEGNVVTVTFGNVAIEELPLALRQFEVLPWTPEGKRNLLSFVAPVVQEIFRIDLRANRIYWGEAAHAAWRSHCPSGRPARRRGQARQRYSYLAELPRRHPAGPLSVGGSIDPGEPRGRPHGACPPVAHHHRGQQRRRPVSRTVVRTHTEDWS